MLKIFYQLKNYWVISMFVFNICLVFYLENYIVLLFLVLKNSGVDISNAHLTKCSERKVSFKWRATG